MFGGQASPLGGRLSGSICPRCRLRRLGRLGASRRTRWSLMYAWWWQGTDDRGVVVGPPPALLRAGAAVNRRRTGAGLPGSPAMDGEAAVRGLIGPAPLRVWWASTDRPVEASGNGNPACSRTGHCLDGRSRIDREFSSGAVGAGGEIPRATRHCPPGRRFPNLRRRRPIEPGDRSSAVRRRRHRQDPRRPHPGRAWPPQQGTANRLCLRARAYHSGYTTESIRLIRMISARMRASPGRTLLKQKRRPGSERRLDLRPDVDRNRTDNRPVYHGGPSGDRSSPVRNASRGSGDPAATPAIPALPATGMSLLPVVNGQVSGDQQPPRQGAVLGCVPPGESTPAAVTV